MTIEPKLWIFLYIFFTSCFLSAQISDSRIQKTLDQKIAENHELLMNGSEKAFYNIDVLLEQAKSQGNQKAELRLLSNKVWYYIRKTDLNNAIKTAQHLDSMAEKYNQNQWRANAHGALLEIYALNELPDQAIAEFKKAIKFLDEANLSDDDLNYSKAVFHIRVAMAYEFQKNFGTAKQMLIKADEYISKVKHDEKRRKIRFMNFSNLAMVNLELNNLDSAEYFIEKSMMLSNGKEDETSLNQFRNYAILGQIYNKKNNPAEALTFLKYAEELEPDLSVSMFEKHVLFEEFTKAYQSLDSTHQAMIYLNKAKNLEVDLEKSKNTSLKKIIKDDLLKEKENTTTYVIVIASILFIMMSIFMFRLYKKNRLFKQQEKASAEYLENLPQMTVQTEEKDYKRLIKMVKNNDPAFLIAFLEIFPDFTENLLKINPKLAHSELEFCAFLKLNLPTNQIAQFRNIEKKSVHIKKYRIRKKLNIPNDVDIYMWFSQF